MYKLLGACLVGMLLLNLLFIILFIPLRVVVSESMAPTYRAGDLLLIDPNMETPIRVGEIVTYTAGKKTITHRVVAIEGNMLVTQGDSNPQPDAWNTPITHVEGRPFLSLPWLGYVFYILKTPLGWVALVLIPTVIILADEMMKIYAALRQAATR